MSLKLIINYISKLLLIALFISLFTFIIPDLIVDIKYWNNATPNYWIIAHYIFIIYIFVTKCITTHVNNTTLTLLNFILTILILACFIIIGTYTMIKNYKLFYEDPVYICLGCHLIYDILVIIFVMTYFIFLSFVNRGNIFKTYKYIYNINLCNYGFTLKEIEQYNEYIYDRPYNRLDRHGKIYPLSIYATCTICNIEYYDKDCVYLFNCGHHAHTKCAQIVMSNINTCFLCDHPITINQEEIY